MVSDGRLPGRRVDRHIDRNGVVRIGAATRPLRARASRTTRRFVTDLGHRFPAIGDSLVRLAYRVVVRLIVDVRSRAANQFAFDKSAVGVGEIVVIEVVIARRELRSEAVRVTFVDVFSNDVIVWFGTVVLGRSDVVVIRPDHTSRPRRAVRALVVRVEVAITILLGTEAIARCVIDRIGEVEAVARLLL